MIAGVKRLPRTLLAVGAALAFNAIAAVPTVAEDVGFPAVADVVLQQGERTLYLELVDDQAIVKYAPGLPGSPSVLEKAAAVASSASGAKLLQVDADSAVAKDAKAAGLSVADYLVGQEDIAFSGPVFKLGDRVLGTSDQVVVTFAEGADAEGILAKNGLTAVRESFNNFWVAKLDTNDGYKTLEVVKALNATTGVVAADVDWFAQYTTDNVTPDFGGTSSAAPVVSGICALVLSINPNLTQTELYQLIRDSASPLPVDDPQATNFGAGIVNAEQAVRLAVLGTNGVVIEPTDADFAATEINDPLLPYQWHLNADWLPDAVEDADIDLREAWAVMNANGFWPPDEVSVAIIDDGVASDMAEINLVGGYDAATNRNQSGNPIECQPRSAGSHGTSVAGVAFGRANNGEAGTGVAPGMPITGVRAIGAPDLINVSAIEDAIAFVLSSGARVINNSWGIPFSNDICDPSDDVQVVPLTQAEEQALIAAQNQNVAVVFSAGNSRANIDEYELKADPRVLAVAASNNRAMSSVYSNYGENVDVAAPSNDFEIDCDNPIWTGGTLGIVTSDMSFMALGGNDPRFDPIDPIAYGGVNTMGILDWNSFLTNHYYLLESRTITNEGGTITKEEIWSYTNGLGIVFPTEAGQVELLPNNVVVDEFGNITGDMTVRVRSATAGIITQNFNVPIFIGRTRSLRVGTIDRMEIHNTSVIILGRGQAPSGQRINFTIQGSENFQVRDGEYTDRDLVTSLGTGEDIPAFRVRAAVAIQGAGTHRTEGIFVRTIPDVGSPVFGNATMYMVDGVPLRPNLPGFVRGGASVDYTIGQELSGTGDRPTDRSMAIVRFSRPGNFGTAMAMLSNGRWRGMSNGYHTADVDQASVDLANLTFFPSRIMFFTPSSLAVVTSTDRPQVVLGK
ncbi:MAG: hypothetical protein PWP23_2623 [Candidatus Sumerlaeota bacterium]|nr:hypothetical protein [Candidatus Sumerlaeota bacterium]